MFPDDVIFITKYIIIIVLKLEIQTKTKTRSSNSVCYRNQNTHSNLDKKKETFINIYTILDIHQT
jgi:hypothetical protein